VAYAETNYNFAESAGITVVTRMFVSSACVGAVLGMIGFLAILSPEAFAGVELWSWTAENAMFLATAALAGVGVGVLACSGGYAVMEVTKSSNLEASRFKQAISGGAGAALGGLLPAVAVLLPVAVASGDLDSAMGPLIFAAALLAACFIFGSAIVAVLNSARVRGAF